MRVPFAHSLGSLFSARRRMRDDWDLRARKDARYYIDCGHGGSERDFWRSGAEDLNNYVLRDLEIDRGASALEIGCGIGRLLRPLSERVASVIGVDISGEMIERAAETLAELANVRLERTDGDLPGVPDASLDLVYSQSVFQHVPTREAVSRYFAEAARVLRAGGVFRFQVDGRSHFLRISDTWRGVRYSGAETRRELAGVGLEVADLSGEGTQYMWITALRRHEAGRPSTSAIRLRPRAWSEPELDALLERLGIDPAAKRERVVAGTISLRKLAGPFARRHRADPPRDYVTAVYRTLLGREPDEGGLAFYAGEIERGVRRTNVVDCLLASAEFDGLYRPVPQSSTETSRRP